MSDHESEDGEEKPYIFVRAQTTRTSTSSTTKVRESFSDIMKRKLPKVFSSFRSSKRRPQLASVQNGGDQEAFGFLYFGQGKHTFIGV